MRLVECVKDQRSWWRDGDWRGRGEIGSVVEKGTQGEKGKCAAV